MQVSSYERIMYITVVNWQKGDQSQFSCISTNSLGKADGRIQSYSKILIPTRFLLPLNVHKMKLLESILYC